MIARTFVSEKGKSGLDQLSIEVVELETNKGRQVRICSDHSDDIQLRLHKGKLTIRYFSEKGTPVNHVVGRQEDEIPF